MGVDSDDGYLYPWIGLLLIVFLIIALFEAILFGIAFFGADKVECNFIWCTATTTRSSGVITQDCYTNGIKTNCSNMVLESHHELEKVINNSMELI
jgi:hypothetical protein